MLAKHRLTADAGGGHRRDSGRPTRRRFLKGLGVGGLATAGIVFGDPSPAEALCYRACCSLYVCPNVTMAHCMSGAHYAWNCKWTSTVGCTCCEHGGLKPYYHGHSAYSCSHV